MIKGVIFDFNGTLFWDTPYHAHAFEIFIERYLNGKDGLQSRPLSTEDLYVNIMGKTNDTIMKFIFQRTFNKEEIERLGEEKEAIYRELCQGKVELAPGALELFAWLKEQDIPFSIASSADKNNIDFYYQQLPLEQWIPRKNVTFNDGSFKEGKPAPDIFLLAAKRMGISPKDIAIFEDSASGIKAAEAAGAGLVIAVSEIPNEYKGAHPVIHNFKQAIPLFV